MSASQLNPEFEVNSIFISEWSGATYVTSYVSRDAYPPSTASSLRVAHTSVSVSKLGRWDTCRVGDLAGDSQRKLVLAMCGQYVLVDESNWAKSTTSELTSPPMYKFSMTMDDDECEDSDYAVWWGTLGARVSSARV